MTTATDVDESTIDGAVKGVQGWIDCFGNARLAGAVCGVGISDGSEAKNHTNLLDKVYNLGKNV